MVREPWEMWPVNNIMFKYDGSTTTDRYILNEYDKLGRQIVVRSQIAESGDVDDKEVIGYGYDAVGNRTAVSVNGQVITRTTYDTVGRTIETIHASGHR